MLPGVAEGAERSEREGGVREIRVFFGGETLIINMHQC